MFESVEERLRAVNNGHLPFEGLLRHIQMLIERVVESKKMGADLLFMVTYMSSITTANITRPEIFSYTAERREYKATKPIARAHRLVKNWHYRYADALRIAADKVRNTMLNSMLRRYANAIDSGVPDDDFLRTELNTVRNIYRNHYEQGLELLKKWGDAYIAMLLSASIVAITLMISIAIYAPEGIEATLNLAYLIIIAISVFGISIMYQAVPDDPRTHTYRTYVSREQGIIRRLEKVVVPLTLAGLLILWLLGINAGVIFLFFGTMLLPLAVLGYVDDGAIKGRDEDFASFIRSLGSIMGGKGITTREALKEVDIHSLPHLAPFIGSIHTKLNLGLNERQSWEKFIGESGSFLIAKYLHIFRDSITLGGDPDRIGKIVGDSMLEQVLLRNKRDMFVKGFVVLLIPMHGAMCGIFVFLFEILMTMSDAVNEVMGSFSGTESALASPGAGIGAAAFTGLNLFVSFPEAQMTAYVVNILIMLTVSNTVAGRVVSGGNRYMYYFFLCVLSLISGIVIIIVPIIVKAFFTLPVLSGGV